MRDGRARRTWRSTLAAVAPLALLPGPAIVTVWARLDQAPGAAADILRSALFFAGPPLAGAWLGFRWARRSGVAGTLGALAALAVAAGVFAAAFFLTVEYSTGMEGLALAVGLGVHAASAVPALVGAAFGGSRRQRAAEAQVSKERTET